MGNPHQLYNLVPLQLVQELVKGKRKLLYVGLLFKTKINSQYLTQFAAFKIGVSSVAWPAGTDTSVVSSLTVCIGSTVTRIYTLLIAASQSCVAFWISQTLIRLAFYIRATLVTWRTLASSSVNIDSTQSFDTTLLIRTWVLTFSLDTCLTQRTLIVTFASS